MSYRISDAHAIPTRDCRGCPLKYPFDKMEIAQSITVHESEKLSARRAAHQYGARHGQTFKTKGTRIWRVT